MSATGVQQTTMSDISHSSPTVERSPAARVLEELLGSAIIVAEDWEAIGAPARDELNRCRDVTALLDRLVELRLLTLYQTTRIRSGKSFGLVLGNYRILDHLGTGGMSVVYKAEHLRLRRPVAIKVVSVPRDGSSRDLPRFYAEIRAIAQLNHPHIVTALDVGEAVDSDDPATPILHYFVMEYVNGQDLEAALSEHGPMPIGKACELVYQVAGALSEAHKLYLIHRDVKPSNVLLTPDGQAKLLDFGLVRHFRRRLTERGVLLGTIDYMAPEQAQDASAVDVRADIYGLGGVLFWCLTGKPPFTAMGRPAQELAARQSMPPPSAAAARPEVPAALDQIISRMMANNPEARYPNCRVVMNALIPFLLPDSREEIIVSALKGKAEPTTMAASPSSRKHHVLVVDDEPAIRHICRLALQSEHIQCEEAADGMEALAAIAGRNFDLVLLDVAMPKMSGLEVCRKLREHHATPHLKIVMFSGHSSGDDLAELLSAGADEYLTKPFSVVQLLARIQAALRLKDAQDRTDLLNRHLLEVNHQLEKSLHARDSDLVHVRNAMVLGLAKLVEYRDSESGSHLLRLQKYCRCLAEEAAGVPAYSGQIDPNFIEMLESCVPLHDLGKIGLPDHIIMKPGKLDADERVIMQAHTIIGADTLEQVIKLHGPAVAFLQMAIDIARHHHEHWDGRGYPDRLTGAAIPLAARIVAICDTYDALRQRRPYKPALPHAIALQIMNEAFGTQFDPGLAAPFQRCAGALADLCRELGD